MNSTKVQEGKDFIESYKDEITINQLRKFLSAINKIQNKVLALSEYKEELPLEIVKDIDYLRVKLAYQAGRFKEVKQLQRKLDPEIVKIKNSRKAFEDFSILVESIIAYQKLKESNKG